METKTRISYNWFGVKRSYPHYHYYLTCVDDQTWVVEDINRPNSDAPDRICYSDLFHGKWIDLVTDYWVSCQNRTPGANRDRMVRRDYPFTFRGA